MLGVFEVVDVTSPDMEPLYNQLVAMGGQPPCARNACRMLSCRWAPTSWRRRGRAALTWSVSGATTCPASCQSQRAQRSRGVTLHHDGLGVRKGDDSNTFVSPLIPASLKPLAQALSRGTRLELHGCSISSSEVDGELCKELAKLVARWVWASTTYQYGLPLVPPVMAFLPSGVVLGTLKPPPLTP